MGRTAFEIGQLGRYLANSLRGELRRRGVTYAEVAELLAVSEPTVSRMMRGLVVMSTEHYVAICVALRLDPGATLNEALTYVEREHGGIVAAPLVPTDVLTGGGNLHQQLPESNIDSERWNRMLGLFAFTEDQLLEAVNQQLRRAGKGTTDLFTWRRYLAEGSPEILGEDARDAIETLIGAPVAYFTKGEEPSQTEYIETRIEFNSIIRRRGGKLAARGAGQELSADQMKIIIETLRDHLPS